MAKKQVSKSVKAILAAGKVLFWQFGIKKVTVEELCTEANVSKMTFYRNFANKEEVALTVLRSFTEQGLEEYRDIMDGNISFSKKISLIVEMKHRNSLGMSKTFLSDVIGGEFETLTAYMNETRALMMQTLAKDFAEAQEKGWIRSDLKISFILYMLDVMNQKLHDPHLLEMYDSTSELTDELTNFFFYGLANSKP